MNPISNAWAVLRANRWLIAIVALLASASTAQAGDSIPLRAGPVTMTFDAKNAFLRHLRVGSHELLRGINAPVRNQNWATVAPEVSNLKVEQHEDHFKVTFDVRCHEGDIDFRWKGTITGTPRGVVEFTFDGVAHSTFRRNRIGFCVLHGPSAAGQPWVIETADGDTSQGKFPRHIAPHQPAKNLRAITHDVAEGIRARVDFEGEVFEMEDQRNWTDASFKTYCTPLEIPYPVKVAEGTRILQKIKVSLVGDLPDNERAEVEGTVLTLGDREFSLPRIGLQVSSEVDDLTDAQVKRLAALHLDFLRVDLALSSPSFTKDLRRAVRQASALGVPLQIGLNLGEAPAFPNLIAAIKELQPRVSQWLVTGGDPADFRKAREQLASVRGEAKIGVTRITNFVDLNRARPEDKTIEVVGFAINPQIHAFDNASMIETLEIHGDVVRSTRQFAGDCPLAIGPITLRPQLVNGEDPPGGPPAGPFPTQVDTRQGTPFAAAWTLGSIKYLAEAGAESAAFYETVGWNGIMDADDVSSRPDGYPSQPGKLFPVYQLFKEIGAFASGKVRQIDSSNPLDAVALVLQKDGQRRVLVANLKDEPQTVTLRGLDNAESFQVLGSEDTRVAPELRVSLPPYGIGRIDQGVD